MDLNCEQKKAVEVVDKPLIVVAGPGTGKTALIVHKIEYLFREKGISLDNILALTFTNKAAEEMSERVEKLVGEVFLANTFHSFALSLIEEFEDKISLIDKNYKLISQTDQLFFFVENLSEFDLKSVELKNNLLNVAHKFYSEISYLKEKGISLRDFEKLDISDLNLKTDLFVAFSKYELYKKKNNFLDYSDILLYLRELLQNNKQVRDEIRKRYSYILIDEFQDTNKVQLDILELISSGDNICVVGDEKQSIYGFRGTNDDCFFDFEKRFKDFSKVFLKKNYRFSKKVLENTNKLILEVSSDVEEVLEGSIDTEGEVSLFRCLDEKSQLSFIAQKISELSCEEKSLKFAVLVRRKSEGEQILKFLRLANIRVRSNLQEGFLSYEIIRFILNVLSVLENPVEESRALFYLLLKLEIRNETLRKISRKSSQRAKSIFKVLEGEEVLSDYEDEVSVIESFRENLVYLYEFSKHVSSLDKLVFEIISRFNLYEKLISLDLKDEIVVLNGFVNFTKLFSELYNEVNLKRFVRYVEITSEIEFDFEQENFESFVEVLTIHAAKGKEFDYVFIPYLNERRFPSTYSVSGFDVLNEMSKEKFLEEEKRLFFVAFSRARLGLFMLYVQKYEGNKLESKPSSFLSILDLKENKFECDYVSGFEKKKESFSDVREKILKKINVLLLDGHYELAKKKIEVLEGLSKRGKKKKDLMSFISESGGEDDEDVKSYLERLEKEKSLDVEFDVEKQIYSVSQLSTYKSCPKKYLFSYIYKIPSVSRHYFDFGTSVHAVLEDLVPKFAEKTKDELFLLAVDMLHKKWISKGYESANQEKEYFKKGLDAIRDFIETQMSLKSGENRKTIGYEKKFLLDIEGKKLIGFIDRIDEIEGGELEILDYKTSNSMESKTNLRRNLQLYVYAMACYQEFKKLPKFAGLWYLIHNKILKVEIEKEIVGEIKKEILELISEIERRNFKAKPSMFACKFCDFNKICEDSNFR